MKKTGMYILKQQNLELEQHREYLNHQQRLKAINETEVKKPLLRSVSNDRKLIEFIGEMKRRTRQFKDEKVKREQQSENNSLFERLQTINSGKYSFFRDINEQNHRQSVKFLASKSLLKESAVIMSKNNSNLIPLQSTQRSHSQEASQSKRRAFDLHEATQAISRQRSITLATEGNDYDDVSTKVENDKMYRAKTEMSEDCEGIFGLENRAKMRLTATTAVSKQKRISSKDKQLGSSMSVAQLFMQRISSAQRLQEKQRINKENQFIAERLMKLPSVLVTKSQHDRSFEKHEQLKKQLIRFHEFKPKEDLKQLLLVHHQHNNSNQKMSKTATTSTDLLGRMVKESQKVRKSSNNCYEDDYVEISGEKKKVIFIITFQGISLTNGDINEQEVYFEIQNQNKKKRSTKFIQFQNLHNFRIVEEIYENDLTNDSRLCFVIFSKYTAQTPQDVRKIGEINLSLHKYYSRTSPFEEECEIQDDSGNTAIIKLKITVNQYQQHKSKEQNSSHQFEQTMFRPKSSWNNQINQNQNNINI